VSCTQNGGLIYMNIQKTQKTNTSSSIPLDITVTDIVNTTNALFPQNAAAPYYVAAGKIYNGTQPVNGTTNWGSIGVPTSPSGHAMLCNALTYDSVNNLLYGGFFDGTGSGYFGLYTMAPGGSSWTQVPDSLITDNGANDKQITYVNAINGDVFVAAATFPSGGSGYVYEIDVLPSGPSNWSQLASNMQKSVTGIGFSGPVAGGTYFVTSGPNLYTVAGSSGPIGVPASWNIGGNPAPASPLFASDGSNSGGDILQGVFVDPLYLGGVTLVIITAANPQVNPPTGNLYYSVNPSSSGPWTHLSQQIGGYNVGFLCAAGPVDSGRTTYLLGTDSGTGGAFGFYSFVPSSNALNRFGGLSYSLYYSAIRRILVDLSNNFVAMGTINNGLWATVPVDPTGGFGGNTWTQE